MTTEAAPLISRVRSGLIHDHGRGVVVAVSGGGDSVGLLRLITDVREDLDLRLSVAHLDHGTRGDVGRADAVFVADLAHSLGLPFDLGHWSPSREGHFEADARAARYAWLVEVARTRDATLVAIGHTKDDQAETILHRILRGTGPRGLAGIPARRSLTESIALIRPLLIVSRDEVRAYLAAIGQPFREDDSNTDLRRTRNRIRHDLLPKLASDYNPNVVEALTRLGEFARDDLARTIRHVNRVLKSSLVSADRTSIVLRREPMERLSPMMRAEVFRMAWRKAGWPEGEMTASRWLRLAVLPDEGTGRHSVARGMDVHYARETVRLFHLDSHRSPRAVASEPVRLPVPGGSEHGKILASLADDVPHDEELDLDQVQFWSDERDERFLTISAPEDGDRFAPLGLNGHSQSLNDFFRGRGVAKEARGSVPVVRDKLGIIWVAGHRIAHRVRLTGETRRKLMLTAGEETRSE